MTKLQKLSFILKILIIVSCCIFIAKTAREMQIEKDIITQQNRKSIETNKEAWIEDSEYFDSLIEEDKRRNYQDE